MKRVVFLVLAGLLLSGLRASAAPDAPADEKEGTIAGTPIKRDQGGWLGLELKEGTFHLTFYNEKKKPVAADRTSAVFRWPVHYQPNDERTELVATDDPDVLASPYPIKPPYSFLLHISLLGGDQKGDVEAYTINFSN